ncbi:MAG: NTP transferase domain-containing protein [Rhodospirillales bacterium]|nr:NTP transferase domain-containing protein [Rhodospirillales bacterium]
MASSARRPDLPDAIVLAGGLGTRLAAVLPNRQKVTAEVAGTPFVVRIIDWLAAAGVRRVVLALGHHAGEVEKIVTGRAWPGVAVVAAVESEPLGTGGALRNALSRTASDPVIVLNGDSFAAIDPQALVAFHRNMRAKLTMALVSVPRAGRYGVVETGDDGAVTAFVEKPADAGEARINAGIYVVSRAVAAGIAAGRAVSLEREIFPAMVGHGFYACGFNAPFIDIGTPESLAAAQTFFAARASGGTVAR